MREGKNSEGEPSDRIEFLSQNFMEIHSKTHQIAPFKVPHAKESWGKKSLFLFRIFSFD